MNLNNPVVQSLIHYDWTNNLIKFETYLLFSKPQLNPDQTPSPLLLCPPLFIFLDEILGGESRLNFYHSITRRVKCSREPPPSLARSRGFNFTAWRAVQHGETTRDPVNPLVSRRIDPSERLLRVAKGRESRRVDGRGRPSRGRVNVP